MKPCPVWKILMSLISKVAAYEENTENPTLRGFLADVALVADIDSMDDM